MKVNVGPLGIETEDISAIHYEENRVAVATLVYLHGGQILQLDPADGLLVWQVWSKGMTDLRHRAAHSHKRSGPRES